MKSIVIWHAYVKSEQLALLSEAVSKSTCRHPTQTSQGQTLWVVQYGLATIGSVSVLC